MVMTGDDEGDTDRLQKIHAGTAELEEVIINAHCEAYLSVSPSEYVTSLHTELNLRTVVEMGEVIEECLEVLSLVADGTASEEDAYFYNITLGSVVPGTEAQFCKSIMTYVK